MKKLIYLVLVVVTVITLTNKLSAQNPIPSFNVPVIADPTTFEETPLTNLQLRTILMSNKFSEQPTTTREERQIIVRTGDRNSETTAWANVVIYSLDGTINYGPFYVSEGYLLEQEINDELVWGVRVLDASTKCTMDVWIE